MSRLASFSGLAVAFDDELSTSDELKEVVEVFLRKTKLKNVDEAVEKFCKVDFSTGHAIFIVL